MTEVVDTVQMRVKRSPTWAELTELKTRRQLELRKEVSYDEVIQELLKQYRVKTELSKETQGGLA